MSEPTEQTSPVEVAEQGSAAILKETMAEITLTWGYLNEAFSVLQEQADQFLALPQDSRVTPEEIQDVRNQIDIHGMKMEDQLSEFKASLESEVRRGVEESVRNESKGWAELIREETIAQVQEQVDLQITEHLPESLQEQVDETKRQIEGIKISLKNSEARMSNSFIGSRDIDDPLSSILTSSGMKSPLYPHSARSLFGYDCNINLTVNLPEANQGLYTVESAKALNNDYELAESDDLFVNIQQFLRHIGTGVEIAASPR